VSGEYLLEVRTEEIPARMLEPAVRHLATRVFEDLMGRGLGPTEVESGYTPRRLVLVLEGLPAGEPDREEQQVGPPARVAYDADGRPTKALEGFARRLGLDPGDLERIETDKGEYVAARQTVRGQATAEVLAELVPRLLMEIPWPKTMLWGDGIGPWVRPVHGVLSLLDGELVPFELFGVAAGARTVGHPLLSPEPIRVTGAGDYRERLAGLGLVVDPAERSRRLSEAMHERARAVGGTLVEDPDLLAKLVAMCEIPGVMEGGFDEDFLELPREVLATSLKDHQSSLTVERSNGGGEGLLPAFLTVMDRGDDPEGRVRSGNEWVVAARLADARFFYAEDRKRPMADRFAGLGHLAFHARLGSYAEKAARLEALAGAICDRLGWADEKPLAERAAHLLKVDLITEMVKEFTSLQGVMGGIYAREDGEPEAVWQAVYDQYLPASTDDPLPRGPVGAVASLADRLDTIVGIFGLGLVPTGSRDPFGLRRAAQGAVRICLERELPLDLGELAEVAAGLYGDVLVRGAEEIRGDLDPFLDDRVRHLLGLAGYSYDEIEAAIRSDRGAEGVRGLPDLRARADALHRVRDAPEFLSVVLAAKRIENIVRDAEPGEPDEALLEEGAERDLHGAFKALERDVEEAAAAGDYEGALRRVGDLAEVLDRFFVDVLVMVDDPEVRRNRLALLQAIGRTLSRVARLTEVVVDREEHRRKHGT
jgi:glycyl-tRNA synthetase beta chain